MSRRTINTGNPTGITDYDHDGFAEIPEWQALTLALNDYAHAAGSAGIIATQDDFAEAVSQLARGIAFMDCCVECRREGVAFEQTRTAPYRVTIEGDWLRGRYRCGSGEHEWDCGYRLDFGGLGWTR